METTLTAIEMTGTIDEQRQLQLDGALPVSGPLRVRVIVLYPLSEESPALRAGASGDETEWLQAAARNPAFDYLKDPREDIYTLADGNPD